MVKKGTVLVVNAIITRDEREVLVLQKRGTDYWSFPGGKVEAGETELAALEREVREELSGTRLDMGSRSFFGYANGISPTSKTPVFVRAYRFDALGEIGKPSAEIRAAEWVSRKNRSTYNLSPITAHFFDELSREGLIS